MKLKYYKHACVVMMVAVLFVPEVAARSSLGIGQPEQAIVPEGVFAGLLFWIQQHQQSFYKAMTSALSALKNDTSQAWGVIGLSFMYGVFHAAGPGHGKAIISSYMIAHEGVVRRGIYLSFAASMLQGISAILIVGMLFLALKGTGVRSEDISYPLEIASYVLVMGLGIYLLWHKLFGSVHVHAYAHSASNHPIGSEAIGESHDNHAGCRHNHGLPPSRLQDMAGMREIWSAIFAVGIRPCTGALIVLSFAFLNGLYLIGILSTVAMSLGTGITIATLALIAVGAKNLAIFYMGMQTHAAIIQNILEILGAVLIFLLGLSLFLAATKLF